MPADRRRIEARPPDHPGSPVDDPSISSVITRIGNLCAAFLCERPAGQQVVILGNVQAAIGKAFLDLLTIECPVIDGAHGDIPIIEVHSLSLLTIGADAEGGLTGPHRSGKGELGRKFAVHVDPFFLPVPAGNEMMPLLGLDQPGLGLVKGGFIVGASCPGPKDDGSLAKKQSNSTTLRIIVLGDQSLPTRQLERANPAFQGQLRHASLNRQRLSHVKVRTRMNRLNLRLFDSKGFEHRILVPVLRVRAQLHDGELIRDGTANAQLNLLASGNALLGIRMQAGQRDRMMRRNILSRG